MKKRTRIEQRITGTTGQVIEVFIDSGKTKQVLCQIVDPDPTSLRLQLRGAQNYWLNKEQGNPFTVYPDGGTVSQVEAIFLASRLL